MDRPFYSVTFGNKNSWDEWNLMPVKAGKIEFVTPTVKYESEDIPGSDDELDMSEVLTGYALYNSRHGSVKFRFYDNGIPVRSRFNQLKNYLHGRRMRAVIEDEPEYYYVGRFMVGDFEPRSGNWGDVSISYILDAYKLEMSSSTENWLWDPFNFETGVIREYANMQISNATAGQDITLIGSRKPTVPKFTVSYYPTEPSPAPTPTPYIEIRFNGVTYECPVKQTTVIPQIVLMDEEYTIHARSMYNQMLMLSVDMRGGSL